MSNISIRTRLTSVALLAVICALALAGLAFYVGTAGTLAMKQLYLQSVRQVVTLQKLSSQLAEIRNRAANTRLELSPVIPARNHLKTAAPEVERHWNELQELLGNSTGPAVLINSRSDESAASATAVQSGPAPSPNAQRVENNDAAMAAAWTELRVSWPAVQALLRKLEKAYDSGQADAVTEILETDWPRIDRSFGAASQQLLPMAEANALQVYESSAKTSRNLSMVAAVLAAICVVVLSIAMITTIRHISASLRQAIRAASSLAAGDLHSKSQWGYRDEIASVLGTLDEARQSLNSAVSRVREGVDALAAAIKTIAEGNKDLSSRTEQQASSLQRTAAAIQELTHAVAKNADSADKLSQLAVRAAGLAGDGEMAARDVSRTMATIQSSSNRIEEFISTIDALASQTNILALNAAVEAARAGEQGKGFAVVAGEVRGLALKSAHAAQEVRKVIAESTERVATGATRVQEAVRTMASVGERAKEVSSLIEQLARENTRQRDVLAQINLAVGELDHMTQQNASLVEEGTAGTESLREQADRIVEGVAVFRLEGTSASP